MDRTRAVAAREDKWRIEGRGHSLRERVHFRPDLQEYTYDKSSLDLNKSFLEPLTDETLNWRLFIPPDVVAQQKSAVNFLILLKAIQP